SSISTTEIYSLSLHDALPIYSIDEQHLNRLISEEFITSLIEDLNIKNQSEAKLKNFYTYELKEIIIQEVNNLRSSKILHNKILEDRKSTRLNSSHVKISYAVF